MEGGVATQRKTTVRSFTRGVHHLALCTDDMKKTSEFYTRVLGMQVLCAGVNDCYGTSNNKLYQIGGQVFYRLKTDWFGIATLHLLRSTNTRSDKLEDPAIIGATGFVRIAKRF